MIWRGVIFKDIYRQSSIKTLYKLQVNKVPHLKVNFKRAKVPSYPKGKLGHR